MPKAGESTVLLVNVPGSRTLVRAQMKYYTRAYKSQSKTAKLTQILAINPRSAPSLRLGKEPKNPYEV